MSTETYEEYRKRRDAENAARMTDPPTHLLWDDDKDINDQDVEYPEGTHVQWVCKCGATELKVFYIEDYYHTYAVCPKCGHRADVHTG